MKPICTHDLTLPHATTVWTRRNKLAKKIVTICRACRNDYMRDYMQRRRALMKARREEQRRQTIANLVKEHTK